MPISFQARQDANEVRRLFREARKRLTKAQILTALGLAHVEWINETFEDEGRPKWRRLTANTIAARRGGSSKILQDTGVLKRSFNFRKRGNSVDVGTNVAYAAPHEEGTRPYTIRPRNAKALSFMTADGRVFARKVNHPGLPKRKMLPTVIQADNTSSKTIEAIWKQLSEGF